MMAFRRRCPTPRSGQGVLTRAGIPDLIQGLATLTMEALAIPGRSLMELHKVRLRRLE